MVQAGDDMMVDEGAATRNAGAAHLPTPPPTPHAAEMVPSVPDFDEDLQDDDDWGVDDADDDGPDAADLAEMAAPIRVQIAEAMDEDEDDAGRGSYSADVRYKARATVCTSMHDDTY